MRQRRSGEKATPGTGRDASGAYLRLARENRRSLPLPKRHFAWARARGHLRTGERHPHHHRRLRVLVYQALAAAEEHITEGDPGRGYKLRDHQTARLSNYSQIRPTKPVRIVT